MKTGKPETAMAKHLGARQERLLNDLIDALEGDIYTDAKEHSKRVGRVELLRQRVTEAFKLGSTRAKFSGSKERADAVAGIPEAHARMCGNHGSNLEEAVTDLMADLRHLAARQGFDWDLLVDRAEMHASAEC